MHLSLPCDFHIFRVFHIIKRKSEQNVLIKTNFMIKFHDQKWKPKWNAIMTFVINNGFLRNCLRFLFWSNNWLNNLLRNKRNNLFFLLILLTSFFISWLFFLLYCTYKWTLPKPNNVECEWITVIVLFTKIQTAWKTHSQIWI